MKEFLDSKGICGQYKEGYNTQTNRKAKNVQI